MFYHSPVGIIKIQISGNYVTELLYINGESETAAESIRLSTEEKKVLTKCITQFDEYFSGKRKIFDLPVTQEGTGFQQKVWNELIRVC